MAMPRGMTYTEKTGLRKDGSFFVSEDYHMWRKQGMPGQIICAFGRLTKDMKDGKIRKCRGNEHIWQSINWKQMFISVHEYWVSHLVAYLGWVDLELGAPTSRSSTQPLLILSQVNPTQCIRRWKYLPHLCIFRHQTSRKSNFNFSHWQDSERPHFACKSLRLQKPRQQLLQGEQGPQPRRHASQGMAAQDAEEVSVRLRRRRGRGGLRAARLHTDKQELHQRPEFD